MTNIQGRLLTTNWYYKITADIRDTVNTNTLGLVHIMSCFCCMYPLYELLYDVLYWTVG